MEVSGQHHVLRPQGKASGMYWLGSWIGPRNGLDAVAKRENPCPARNETLVMQPIS